MSDFDSEHCQICKRDLPPNPRWSVCYDPFADTNVWGGDTHVYKAYICDGCAAKIGVVATDDEKKKGS
jgi:hypothetical protein